MIRRALQFPLLGLAVASLVCSPVVAMAHSVSTQVEPPDATWTPPPDDVWTNWAWEPVTLTGLGLIAVLYAVGVSRLWRAAGNGHGIRRWEVGCFIGGWWTLFIALISPIHPLGQMLFFVHMLQHELLMLVAAPLIVLGRPMIAFLRALPPATASRLGRFSNSRFWVGLWGAVTTPFIAWLLHAAILWLWHAPALFEATLHNDWVHAAQHISFLGSALLFWWALLHGKRTAASLGVGVLYLFTTAIHSGLLGALLTFARSVWYPAYRQSARAWGMSPLEDQQLGGLIMWVPACLVYIAAGLWMFAAWLRQSEKRVVDRTPRRLGKLVGEGSAT